LTGLNASAVGLIAFAGYQLSLITAPTHLTKLVLFASAAIGSCYDAIWLFPILIVGGGIVTLVASWKGWARLAPRRHSSVEPTTPSPSPVIELPLNVVPTYPPPSAQASTSRLPTPPPDDNPLRRRRTHESSYEPEVSKLPEEAIDPTPINLRLGLPTTIGLVTLFFCILIVVVVLRATLSNASRALQLFTNMFIAGSVLFGGGPSVASSTSFYSTLQSCIMTPFWPGSAPVRDLFHGWRQI
jgi:hypothetical protein